MSEEKKKRKWTEGSYIRAETDLFEAEQGEDYYFAWFHTESNLKPSEREEQEKVKAIQEQIQKGVIQPNGMPVGWQQPQKKETRLERQARRKQERKMEKRLRKQGKVPFQVRKR